MITNVPFQCFTMHFLDVSFRLISMAKCRSSTKIKVYRTFFLFQSITMQCIGRTLEAWPAEDKIISLVCASWLMHQDAWQCILHGQVLSEGSSLGLWLFHRTWCFMVNVYIVIFIKKVLIQLKHFLLQISSLFSLHYSFNIILCDNSHHNLNGLPCELMEFDRCKLDKMISLFTIYNVNYCIFIYVFFHVVGIHILTMSWVCII